MVYKVNYINENGHKQTRHFMAQDIKELFKYLTKKDFTYYEILEIKCVVHDYVETISYDDYSYETKVTKKSSN